jgi:hypothetical protein
MAYEFNGTNQYLSMAAASVTTAPITLACWFYPTDTNLLYALMCLNSTSTTDRHVLYARGEVAGDPIRIQSTEGGVSSNADTSAGFTSSTWQHACGVVSAPASRTAYLNGGNSGTNTTSASPLNITQQSIAAQRFNSFPNGTSFLGGLIAEVGIWNAALTAAEIASLAKGMTCDKIRPQSLVFYAPLVRDLIDQKGGLTITNNNAATVADQPRVYA